MTLAAVQAKCHWTCYDCAADDITACPRANTWGVTFDDGPTEATPRLLDYLKSKSLKASFFLIGSNVAALPEYVKREVAEGHHLASHTWSHTALTTLTNEQIVAEMKWTEKAVLEATGLRLKYMRPPYGDINNRVRFVLKKLGYIVVDWTGDAFDTNDWNPNLSDSKKVSLMTKSLDKYVAGKRTKGFYMLEHDQSDATVNLAPKLLPLGLARNITMANIPMCQGDKQPYQAATTTKASSTTTKTTSKKTTKTTSKKTTKTTSKKTTKTTSKKTTKTSSKKATKTTSKKTTKKTSKTTKSTPKATTTKSK
ncbi:chitin deacetylase [Mortierella sp. AD010]|nr:chitin deacetylase [Mortierella sp. AD010]